MLSHFLRATQKSSGVPIQYVGGYVEALTGSNSNITVSLTSLTGGLASAPSENDLVIVSVGVGSASAVIPSVSGYTRIAYQFAADSSDTSLYVGIKFMSPTPDTSITLTGGTGSTNNAGTVYISVWRNVSQTSAFISDKVSITALENSVLADPPSITPTIQGSYVIAVGAGAHTAGVQTYSSSDLSEFLTIGSDDTQDSTIGGGYKQWVSGAFNPAAFTFSTSNSTAYSSCAASVVIEPAAAFFTKVFSFSGTYNFVVPAGVSSISMLAAGGGGGGYGNGSAGTQGGGGGGGGALSYSNSVAVTAGETLTIVVGVRGYQATNGGASSISRGATKLVEAMGGISATSVTGAAGGAAASGTGDVKYSGGNGASGLSGDPRYGGGGGGVASTAADGPNGVRATTNYTSGRGGRGIVFAETSYTLPTTTSATGVTSGGGGGGSPNNSGGGGVGDNFGAVGAVVLLLDGGTFSSGTSY